MKNLINYFRTDGRLNIVRVILPLFFLLAAILPLCGMFARIASPEAQAMLGDDGFWTAARNSVLVSLTGMTISVSLAFAASRVLTRTNIKGKTLFAAAMTIPMLIPSLAHGMGLIHLFGSNGLITNLLNANWSIYGFWGIVTGSVLYSFPPAFLMLYDVMRYEDASVYEAADVLGIPKARQIFSITLPYLKKPLISVAFATFTLIVTDYGVPLMLGGRCTTLPVLMYEEVVGLLNFDTGVAIGAVLLIPAVIAFLLDVASKGRSNLSYVARPFVIKPNKARDAFGYTICISILVFLASPLAAFTIVAFVTSYPLDMTFTLANIERSVNLNMMDYLLNSLFVAFAVSAIGTFLAWFAGYLTSRVKGAYGRMLHLACITTLAVPGIVLGLSYAMFFRGTVLSGTFAILICVNLVHFFASPYLLAYNALGKINSNLESVGLTLGIGRLSIVKDVLIPQTRGTLLEMFSYFFVNCMVTISAVAFLSTTLNMPLALLISDLDTQRLTECAALVALVIFIVNAIMKGVIALAKKKFAR